ncbi:unnamed protein product, partial [Ceratitis capitata]
VLVAAAISTQFNSHRAITHYNDTGNIAKRHETKELKISDRSIRRVLEDDHNVKPYKNPKTQDLIYKQQQVEIERTKELLRLS